MKIIFLSIILLIVITYGTYLFFIEFNANKKRQKIRSAREIVLSNSLNKTNIHNISYNQLSESIIFAGGSGILTLIDLYHSMNSAEEYLNILVDRFPNELHGMDTSRWINKIESLYSQNPESIQGYINNLKGVLAEKLAAEFLTSQGLEVSSFEKLNHPNDDLLVKLDDKFLNVSVKCGSVDYIQHSIKEHPESRKYIINTESFEEMTKLGLIESYSNQGIEILDGQYSDNELSNISNSVFSDIHNSTDVTHHIPILTTLLLTYKISKEVKDYSIGKSSINELGINVTMDVARIGTNSFIATITGKIGTGIGTMCLPGIGAIIGGVLGVLAGSITGNYIIYNLKTYFKWRHIIEAMDKLGNEFCTNLPSEFNDYLSQYIPSLSVIQSQRDCEEKS